MNIGIIGQGFVGNAIYQKLSKYYKVFTYDLNDKLCNSTFDETVSRCKIVFVCLPTPMNQNGSCNLDIIEDVLSQINEYTDTERIVVIKSTIIPGATDEFNSKYKNI